jgi:hypothetical protein
MPPAETPEAFSPEAFLYLEKYLNWFRSGESNARMSHSATDKPAIRNTDEQGD